ncbi:Zinc finger BED domain-containing protein 5 [Trichinella sp. T6]|nr:Zinc finger BED domain-containing protein 5 [Trichinella sp. T6]
MDSVQPSQRSINNLKNALNTAVKIINFIKSKPLQSCLFEKLCEEMGSCHKSLFFHSEVRWLSRGKVLTRLVVVVEVVVFLKGQSDYSKVLRDEKFVLKLTYLTDIFSVHDKIQGFTKKLSLWKKMLKTEIITLATFIVEKEATLDEDSMIVAHLDSLKEKMCDYSHDSVKNYSVIKIFGFFGYQLKTHPTLPTAALKVLLPFTTSYMCKIGFSAMIGIKTKFRNKLQLSNILRLKLTHVSVDVEEVISQNRKQAHCLHTPHYAFH